MKKLKTYYKKTRKTKKYKTKKYKKKKTKKTKKYKKKKKYGGSSPTTVALANEEAQHRQSKQQLETHAQGLHTARQDLKETQRAFADFTQAGLDERGALLAERLAKSEGEAMRFPTTNYKAIQIFNSDLPDACNTSCNKTDSSKEFDRVYRKFKDLFENKKVSEFKMDEKNPIDLYRALIRSADFYKNILAEHRAAFKKKYGRELQTPDEQDISSLIDYICNITGKELCILIGFAEMLAIFGINFHEQLSQLNLEDISADKINEYVQKVIKYVVSSMDEKLWSPWLNQELLLDGALDKPEIYVEPWHLKDAALCLIMPDRIHEDDNLVINWPKALEIAKCRVTRNELCFLRLIMKYKNLEILYTKFGDYHVYIFYSRN